MKHRKWIWIIGILALVSAIPLVLLKLRAANDEAAFQEQLRLARAEGLPTNATEYKATVPTALPSENAASPYRQLHGKGGKADLPLVDQELLFQPGAVHLASAQTILTEGQKALGIVDKAVQLPRCWFDRDWSQGAGVPFPEYTDMNLAAQLMGLRGSLSATRGDVAGALADSRRIL